MNVWMCHGLVFFFFDVEFSVHGNGCHWESGRFVSEAAVWLEEEEGQDVVVVVGGNDVRRRRDCDYSTTIIHDIL